MTACPSCPRTWSSEETLAAHLIDAHGFEAKAAVERARAATKDQGKIDRHAAQRSPQAPQAPQATEDDMASNSKGNATCHACGARGHTRRSSDCPQRGQSAATTTRKAITRRHPKTGKPPSGGNGGMLEELDALRTVASALDVLPDVEARGRVIALAMKLFNIDLAA